MSPQTQGGSGWLDSLARWAVRRERTSTPVLGDGTLPVVRGGTTRRNALRTAAGAAGVAALAGPLRLAEPPFAGAAVTALTECQIESFEKIYADFGGCIAKPSEEVEEVTELLRIYEGSAGKKSLSKRQKKVVGALRRRRSKAIKEIQSCNALMSQERAEGEEGCQAKNPSGEPGSGGGTKTPGCETGTILCGEDCCDIRFAFCQGCLTPTCCRIDGNCCPGGG